MFGGSHDASNALAFRKAECAEWDRVFQQDRFQRGDKSNPMMSSRDVVAVPGAIDTVEQLQLPIAHAMHKHATSAGLL